MPIYNLGARETSRITVGILKFNAWGPFLADGVVPGPFRACRRPARNKTRWREGRGLRLPEILTTMAPNLVSGWPTGGALRVPWYSQTPPTMNPPSLISPPEETPTYLSWG
jgi:hypothetical protein